MDTKMDLATAQGECITAGGALNDSHRRHNAVYQLYSI